MSEIVVVWWDVDSVSFYHLKDLTDANYRRVKSCAGKFDGDDVEWLYSLIEHERRYYDLLELKGPIDIIISGVDL